MDKRLNRLLLYAKEQVPYYEKLIFQDPYHPRLDEFPINDKYNILTNGESFISKEYNFFPLTEQIEIVRTSGSTGTYLKFQRDKRHYVDAQIELCLLRKSYYGITPTDYYCYFYSTMYAKNRLVKEKEYLETRNSIGFERNNLTKEKIIWICEKILEKKPKWMIIQPSMATLLARQFEKDNSDIGFLKYIELTGEMLSTTARFYLQSIFKGNIANHYGANEVNPISYECPYGHMHVCSSNVVVEILDDEGNAVGSNEEGNIHLTGKNSFAMPFIRYSIGDQGSWSNKKCSCKNKAPILILHNGRKHEFAIDKKGNEIQSFIFIRPIEYINEKIGRIIYQFQVEQISEDYFKVKLGVKPSYLNWKEPIEKMYMDSLKQDSLKDAIFEFEYYEELVPNEKTGKLAFFTRSF